jgi:hypothetical protein
MQADSTDAADAFYEDGTTFLMCSSQGAAAPNWLLCARAAGWFSKLVAQLQG